MKTQQRANRFQPDLQAPDALTSIEYKTDAKYKNRLNNYSFKMIYLQKVTKHENVVVLRTVRTIQSRPRLDTILQRQ